MFPPKTAPICHLMRSFRFLTVAVAIMMLGLNAHAHSPYVGERCETRMPDGEPAVLVLHYGDGIIVADPVEPAILDNEDRVIGLGPVGAFYYLFCANSLADIRLYEPFQRVFVSVDITAVSGEPLTDKSLRDWYPELEQDTLVRAGFSVRATEPLESFWIEVSLLPRHWPGIIWHTMLWLIVLLPWGSVSGKSRPLAERVFFWTLRIIGFVALFTVSTFSALVYVPHSPRIYAFVVCVSFVVGLALRFWLTSLRTNDDP